MNIPLNASKERGSRLTQLRKLTRLSRRKIEEMYNIKASTLKSWEQGRYGGITEKGLNKIRNLCEQENIALSIDWLLYGQGVSPAKMDLRSLDASMTVNLLNETQKIEREYKLFQQHYTHTLMCQVCDDTMAPFAQINDHVAGPQVSDDQIDSLINKICIVQTHDDQLYVRLLKKGSKQQSYNLLSANLNAHLDNAILDNVTLKSAAEVLWIRKDSQIKGS